MPKRKIPSELCAKGHRDWTYDGDGGRRCAECRREYQRTRDRGRSPSRLASWAISRGRELSSEDLLWDTLTYSQVMKARGY